VAIGEVQELINEGFEQVMKEGPLCREPCVRLKITITDCKLHEDAIHRGPAQVLPAVRSAIKQAMIQASAVMQEPVQIHQIEAPSDYIGDLNKLIQNKRGQLMDMQQEAEHVVIKAKLPVAEMFGFSSDLRSATSGRGSNFIVDQMFEKIPRELQDKVVSKIRDRKGLKSLDLEQTPEE
jgi:elongation factor 2